MKKVLDKPERICYTIIRKREGKPNKPERKKVMMYIRSTLTGQIYEVDFLPQFSGYEVVTKTDYEAWLKKMGL